MNLNLNPTRKLELLPLSFKQRVFRLAALSRLQIIKMGFLI